MNYRIYRIARLKEIVEQAIKERQGGVAPEPVKAIEFKTANISLGPNVAVLIPNGAIKSDGSVDFVFTFKALAAGDAKGAANTGVNAVFVTCYIRELGSGKHEKQFGNQRFINGAIASVIAYIKKETKRDDIKQGKLGIVGWSGGGPAISKMLRDGLVPNSVVILDGLHSNKDPRVAAQQLKAVKEFAERAAKDPANYRFTTVSTGVMPGTYRSTSETSKDVADATGMSPATYAGPGAAPYAILQNGGAQWIQLYRPNEKDVNKMKEQHAHAYWWGAGNNNLEHLLGWDKDNTGAKTAPPATPPDAVTTAPATSPSPAAPRVSRPNTNQPAAPQAPLTGTDDGPSVQQTETGPAPEKTPAEKTIFVGDSLMVGLAGSSNFKRGYNCYLGGMPTGWMLGKLRNYFTKGANRKQQLNPAFKGKIEKVVIMGGVNDISGEKSAGQVIDNLRQMYALALNAGLKVVACTIPYWDQEKGIESFKKNYKKLGYGGYRSSADTLKKTTEEVNDWIMSQNDPSAGIISVNTYAATSDTKKYRKTDFVHFFGESYKLLADLISSQGGIS